MPLRACASHLGDEVDGSAAHGARGASAPELGRTLEADAAVAAVEEHCLGWRILS